MRYAIYFSFAGLEFSLLRSILILCNYPAYGKKCCESTKCNFSEFLRFGCSGLRGVLVLLEKARMDEGKVPWRVTILFSFSKNGYIIEGVFSG